MQSITSDSQKLIFIKGLPGTGPAVAPSSWPQSQKLVYLGWWREYGAPQIGTLSAH